AYVKLFCSAYACSTYPTAPVVCLTVAATPELPFAPVPVGHLTVLSGLPAAAVHCGLYADRNCANAFVVPEESERCTTVIEVLGRLAPGLSALIAGSFQALTLPI